MDYIALARLIQQKVPEVSLPLIKSYINVRQRQILQKRDWEFLNKQTLIATAAAYEDGTISITSGATAVVGVGTVFTTAMVGRSLYVGTTHAQGYIISAYTDGLNITLATGYAPVSDASGEDFSIKALRYTPAVDDIAILSRIVYDERQLIEKPLDYFDRIDPDRSDTGEPVYYAVVGKSAQSGTVTFEIFPAPAGEYVLRVVYKRKAPDLSANSDESLIDAHLLEAAVLWDCYRIFGAKNPAYIGLARDAKIDYAGALQDAIDEDLELTSLPDKVRDVSGGDSYMFSDEYSVNHDVGI